MAVAVRPNRVESSHRQTIELLELAVITPAPDNPRSSLGDVDELAASMRELGMLEPLIVTPRQGKFMVVCGHRRYAAAKKAKLGRAPAIVREFDEPQRIKAMLIENCQREDLAAIEEARAYKQLVELGLTQRQIAGDVGKSQAHISKRLALLDLPEEAIKQLDSGGITLADAVEISKLAKEPDRVERVLARPHYRTVEAAVEMELEKSKRDKEVAKLSGVAIAEGLRVVAFTVTDDYGYQTKLPRGVFEISKSPQYGAVLGIDPVKHASDPCHAIAIHPRTKKRVPVCTDRTKHPKAKTPDERWREQSKRSRNAEANGKAAENAKAEREALAAAEQARIAFVTELFGRKTGVAKNVMLDWILRGVIEMGLYGDGFGFAMTALGLTDEKGVIRVRGNSGENILRDYAGRGERELMRAAFAIILGETDSGCDSWHGSWGETQAGYIALLEQHGYPLTDTERNKLPKTKPAKKAA